MLEEFFASIACAALAELPLEPFRGPVERLLERTATGAWAMPDDEVRTLERRLADLVALPPPWRVELAAAASRARGFAHIERAGAAGKTPEYELLCTRLVGRDGASLWLRTTFDLQCLELGSAWFVGPAGRTPFAQAQFERRTDFLPLHALPIVLGVVDGALQTLPTNELELFGIDLQSPQPLAPAPSVRCKLLLADARESKVFEARVSGVLALPRSAAHPAGFAFRGARPTAARVGSRASSSRPLALCVQDVLDCRALLPPASAWTFDLFHDDGSDELRLFAGLRRAQPRAELLEWNLEIAGAARADESGKPFVDLALAGLPVSATSARAILTALEAARDPARESIFSVTGCAARRALDVVFVASRPEPSTVTTGSMLRLALASDGAIERADSLAVERIWAVEEPEHLHWTCEIANGERIELWIHGPVFCDVGEDLRARARLGELPLVLAGGCVEQLRPGF